MKYFLDTEFYEDGERIHLISIGIVCEDGRELYAENSQFDRSIVPADHFVRTDVLPHMKYLVHDHQAKDPTQHALFHNSKEKLAAIAPRAEISKYITHFVEGTTPVFYGYFADYDWVVLCQLFGRMVDLPKGFPYFCMDLKQMMEERGLTKEWKQTACPDPIGEHNALVDARWNMALYKAIMEQA